MTQYALTAALLYFAAYVPFAYLSGKYQDVPALSACAVLLCMSLIWTLRGLWRQIRFTAPAILSGLCTAGIIGTTIAALAYKGTSVFRIALITRGAVLLLAPVSDWLTGNRITRSAIYASCLSCLALVLMHLHKLNGRDAEMPLELALIMALYVGCYAVKLPLFSAPKRGVGRTSFLVTEQTVAVGTYVAVTLCNHGLPSAVIPAPIAIGVFSQLTGIAGGAVLISPAEHTAAVPLNRAASMTAGLIGSALLNQPIHNGQIAGFALLLIAVMVLIPRQERTR